MTHLQNIEDALDGVPEAQCPKCGCWQIDLDGFGVLKCTHCDYCKHASVSDGVCGFCGITVSEPESHA